MGFDRQRTIGELLAQLSQIVQVGCMNGQVVDRYVIGGILRVRPSIDGLGGSVQDLFGVRAGEVGGEGNVEGEVNCSIGSGRGAKRRHTGSRWFLMRVNGGHVHIRPGATKIGAHPF